MEIRWSRVRATGRQLVVGCLAPHAGLPPQTTYARMCTHAYTYTYICIQYLSYRFVLAAVGKHYWRAVGEGKFPVRILVAGKGSVCRPDNIRDMVNMVPRARVVNFPESDHSIHNSRSEDFTKTLEDVYKELGK